MLKKGGWANSISCFRLGLLPIDVLCDERDHKMTDFMVDLWTNFATHQNPTPKDNAWPVYGVKGATYVRLENSQLIAKRDPERDERLKFWKKLVPWIAWINILSFWASSFLTWRLNFDAQLRKKLVKTSQNKTQSGPWPVHTKLYNCVHCTIYQNQPKSLNFGVDMFLKLDHIVFQGFQDHI